MAVKDFTDVVKRAFNEFVDEMNMRELNGSDEQNGIEQDNEPNRSDEQNDIEQDNEPNGNSGQPTKLKFTNIRATMPDGSVIHHPSGKATYLEVLEKLGLEKVMQVRPNIVSKEQFSQKSKGVKRGEFWVRGTIRFSGTQSRKAELDKIADLLGVKLNVEIVEKKSKSE